MNKGLPIFFITLISIVFIPLSPLPNGQNLLANLQFEQAKTAFNRQDYFKAERLAGRAHFNSLDAAGPWLLAGNCFYLQGQDSAALFNYSMALALDPAIGHLPPFVAELRHEPPCPEALTPRGEVWVGRAGMPKLAKTSHMGLALALTPTQLYLLRKKIGQMIMVSVPGTRLSGQKKALLNAGWVGGVILFDQNVRSKKQVTGYIRELQKNSPTPLFVAVDQEGGTVRRFKESEGFQRLPSLAALGQTQNPDLAYRFGLLSGKQLKAVGANLNLAPVVDINEGPDSIISRYHRSLGSDPQLVSTMALQIVRGMRAQNIIATAKHFPAETEATANPHDGVAVTDVSRGRLESFDLVPYRNLIQNHLLDAVMLSHVVYKNVDPFYPASLSPEMIQKILRGELGYQGLVISDDLRMDAIKERYPLDVSVVQAVNAGVDVLLVTDNYERRVMDSLVKAVVSGRVALKTIDGAYSRIMATKKKYGILKKGPTLAALPQAAPEKKGPNSPLARSTSGTQSALQVAQSR